MESVIIVTPYNFDEIFKARIPRKYNVEKGALGNLVISDGWTRLWLSQDESILNTLDDAGLEKVINMFRDPIFYTLDFSDIKFCREVLLAIVDDPAILVDNDHGVMMSGPEFVHFLCGKPDWDWR